MSLTNKAMWLDFKGWRGGIVVFRRAGSSEKPHGGEHVLEEVPCLRLLEYVHRMDRTDRDTCSFTSSFAWPLSVFSSTYFLPSKVILHNCTIRVVAQCVFISHMTSSTYACYYLVSRQVLQRSKGSENLPDAYCPRTGLSKCHA